MKDILITKADLNSENEYTLEIEYESNLIVEADLGWVKFKKLDVAGYILTKAGSGIEAGEGIEAGWGIKAGWGITCKILNCKFRIFVGVCTWRIPTDDEKTLFCTKFTGELAYGIFKQIPE